MKIKTVIVFKVREVLTIIYFKRITTKVIVNIPSPVIDSISIKKKMNQNMTAMKSILNSNDDCFNNHSAA